MLAIESLVVDTKNSSETARKLLNEAGIDYKDAKNGYDVLSKYLIFYLYCRIFNHLNTFIESSKSSELFMVSNFLHIHGIYGKNVYFFHKH